MEKMTRREFLRLIGLGSVGMAAVGAVPGWALSNSSFTRGTKEDEEKETYSFRAVGGLPQGPFPSYASYVIEGTVNLVNRSGVITKNLFAGPPELTSTIAIPGLTRIVRVVNMNTYGKLLLVTGQIDDSSHLQHGESPKVNLTIDRESKTLRATFLDSGTTLKIVS